MDVLQTILLSVSIFTQIQGYINFIVRNHVSLIVRIFKNNVSRSSSHWFTPPSTEEGKLTCGTCHALAAGDSKLSGLLVCLCVSLPFLVAHFGAIHLC